MSTLIGIVTAEASLELTKAPTNETATPAVEEKE